MTMTPPTTETGIVEKVGLIRQLERDIADAEGDGSSIAYVDVATVRAAIAAIAAMPDSTQLLQTMAGALEEARGDVDFACTAIMKLHEQKARMRLEQTLRRLDTALAQFRAQEQRS